MRDAQVIVAATPVLLLLIGIEWLVGLRRGRNTCRLNDALKCAGKVATLADQDAGPKGVFVDFFGRPASTHEAIALMAWRFHGRRRPRGPTAAALRPAPGRGERLLQPL